MDAQLNEIDAVFLDLDGTIYLGGDLIEGAEAFLQRCTERGVRRYFLSNNSSKSVEQYLKKLHGLGLEAKADDVLLSTHDLLAWLKKENVTETWMVGTEGMRSMLEQQGIATTSSAPQYVVLGYDTELTYDKISMASIHMHSGVPLVASHPDMVCPSPDGGLPDVGAYPDCTKNCILNENGENRPGDGLTDCTVLVRKGTSLAGLLLLLPKGAAGCAVLCCAVLW